MSTPLESNLTDNSESTNSETSSNPDLEVDEIKLEANEAFRSNNDSFVLTSLISNQIVSFRQCL